MTDLAHDVYGQGPAVMLVPAAIGSRHQYDRVAEDLAEDFTVVTLDPRGQGESPDPIADYFDHDDALSVLAAVGLDHAVWVGCSNGGRIVSDVAATSPARVDGLVLLGASLPGATWEDFPLDRQRLEEGDQALAEGDFEVMAQVYADLFVVGPGRTINDMARPLRDRLMSLLMTTAAREQGAWDNGEAGEIDPPLRNRLEDIVAPTLVAVGAHDHPAIHAAARAYREGLPNASATIIQGVAHLPALEAPAVTAELIRDHATMVLAERHHAPA